MNKILFATTNPGKIKEIKKILNDFPITTLSLQDIDPKIIQDLKVEETGDTFEENAIIKAKAYAQATGMLAISDDSGLVVDALDGHPGVHSRRYGKTNDARNQKLLQQLQKVNDPNRTAHFICVIAIHDPDHQQTYTVEGITHGKITRQPIGTNGFGYDPIFYSADLHKTFAQSTPEEKNQVSHRGRALQKAKKILKKIRLVAK